MRQEHVPSQNLQAEQAVLGALMIDNAAIVAIADTVTAADFYRPIHAKIFTAIQTLAQTGTIRPGAQEAVDLISLAEELARCGWLEEIGGYAYLLALIEACQSSAQAPEYAAIVADKSLLRRLDSAAEKIRGTIHSDKSARDQVEAAGATIFELGVQTAGGGYTHAGPAIDDVFAKVKQRHDGDDNDIIGIPTGFDFDVLTGGLQRGEMTILAARPGMGKSALAMQIAMNVATGNLAFNAARSEALPVAYISLEMSQDMLLTRALAQIAGVSSSEMRRGRLSPYDFGRVETARSIIRNAKFYVDDARGSTTFQMLARTRKVAMEAGGLGLIVVDYLQLARTAGRPENRVQELSQIGKALRAMALQFNCHVLALAQLSRSVEQREDKHPVLSDLRDSGTIEEDADVVKFIYRPGYYARKGSDESSDPTTEIIYGKNRNESQGSVPLHFLNDQVRFVNPAPRYDEQRSNDYNGYNSKTGFN